MLLPSCFIICVSEHIVTTLQRFSEYHYQPDMDEEEEDTGPFHYFTRETLFNIQRRIAEEKAASQAPDTDSEDEPEAPSEKQKPNPRLEAGKKLLPSLGEHYPSSMVGKPLEDLDPYYQNQEVRY